MVIIGICILPALYAWFNITATWNPYSNTDNIEIAVVNLDKEAVIEGQKVNAGDEIVKGLAPNKDINWKFIGKKKAIDGVKSSDYYT